MGLLIINLTTSPICPAVMIIVLTTHVTAVAKDVLTTVITAVLTAVLTAPSTAAITTLTTAFMTAVMTAFRAVTTDRFSKRRPWHQALGSWSVPARQTALRR